MRQLITCTKEMLRDRRFLKKALMIACPVALQGMLNTVVNMVDTLMIGGLGSSAIAAVGLANKYFFVFERSLACRFFWRPQGLLFLCCRAFCGPIM